MKKMSWNFLLFALTGFLLICSGCMRPSEYTEPKPTSSVYIRVDESNFTITNASKEAFKHQNGFSGDLSILTQEHLDVNDQDVGEYRLEVPYSKQFTYKRLDGEQQIFGVALPCEDSLVEYAVSGTGLDEIVIDLSGQVSFKGKEMTFIVFLSLPCDELGSDGCIRFYGTAKESVNFKVVGNSVEFSGVEPQSAAISYAGEVSNPYLYLDLTKGNGTLDFSNINEGGILIS